MANKKKQNKPKKTAANGKAMKKTRKKKPVRKKKATPKKTLARKKPAASKKPAAKRKVGKTKAVAKSKNKRTTRAKTARASGKGQSADIESFASEEMRARSAGQAGGLQGLSDAAGADSESVDELIEEGNAFEAGVVSGVEAADSADEQEVRTHEVPEDDVPGEYLDQD